MARINTDDDQAGPKFSFEMAATQLIQADPVAKRLSSKKRALASADISGVEADTNAVNVSTMAAGIGKTGVHFWYHESSEYTELTKEQREELKAWRATPAGQAATKKDVGKGKRPGNKRRKSRAFKKAVAKAVEARVSAAAAKTETATGQQAQIKDAVKDAIQGLVSDTQAEEGKKQVCISATDLVSILKKAKKA